MLFFYLLVVPFFPLVPSSIFAGAFLRFEGFDSSPASWITHMCWISATKLFMPCMNQWSIVNSMQTWAPSNTVWYSVGFSLIPFMSYAGNGRNRWVWSILLHSASPASEVIGQLARRNWSVLLISSFPFKWLEWGCTFFFSLRFILFDFFKQCVSKMY